MSLLASMGLLESSLIGNRMAGQQPIPYCFICQSTFCYHLSPHIISPDISRGILTAGNSISIQKEILMIEESTQQKSKKLLLLLKR